MKQLFSVIVLTLFSFWGQAQDLSIAPAHLVSDYQLPEKIDNSLKQRMLSVLSREGIGAEAERSAIALVPRVAILNEENTGGYQPTYKMDLELIFSLVDLYDGTVFFSHNFRQQSKGTSKANAIAKALSAIDLNGSEFASFIASAQGKALEYLERTVKIRISQAQTARKAGNYAEAISLLSSLPERLPSYPKVLQEMTACYDAYREQRGKELLLEAQGVWASTQTLEGAEQVAALLAEIPTGSSSFAGAKRLMADIAKRVKDLDAREWASKERELARRHQVRKAAVGAIRAIGVAYAKSRPRVVKNVILWR